MAEHELPLRFYNPSAFAFDTDVVIALLADRQIRNAIERGEFDNLPGAGKPLDLPDHHDPDWWLKNLMKREGLVMLPPSVQLRVDDAALDEQLKEIWDNAGKALIQNELALQIYDEEELDQAGEIWYEVQSNSTDQEGETDVAAFADGLHQALTAYLRGLFTPQRVSALKSRLDEVLHDPQYGESDHVPFLVMLREDLKEEFDFDRFSLKNCVHMISDDF